MYFTFHSNILFSIIFPKTFTYSALRYDKSILICHSHSHEVKISLILDQGGQKNEEIFKMYL